jgi:hypothetical protein
LAFPARTVHARQIAFEVRGDAKLQSISPRMHTVQGRGGTTGDGPVVDKTVVEEGDGRGQATVGRERVARREGGWRR